MQSAIGAYVRYRESAPVPPPPKNWPDLHHQMEIADLAETPTRSWPVWRFAAASVFGLAILASTILLRQQPPPRTMPVPPPATKPAATPTRATAEPAPPPKTEQPNLLTTEVAVLHALHLAAADLGDPIEVTAAPIEILVTALALPPDLEKTAFPLPSRPDGRLGFAPFVASYTDSSSLNASSLPVDHLFGTRISLFARYNHAPSNTVARLLSLNNPTTTVANTDTLATGATWMLSPRWTNELRFNHSYTTGESFSRLDDFGGARP